MKRDTIKKKGYGTVSNYCFLIKEASRVAPWKLPIELGIKILNNVMATYSSVWFCYYVVDCMEKGKDYSQVLGILSLFVGLYLALAVMTQWYMKREKDRQDMRIRQSLHQKLYWQSVRLELQCYEEEQFYNSYKRAAECVDKTTEKVFANLTNMAGFVAMFLGTFSVLATIEPALWLFALLGIFSFFINKDYSEKVYEAEKALSAFTRKQDYMKRMLLSRDNAKEMRMSNLYKVLSAHFKEATEGKIRLLDTYAPGLKVRFFFRELCSTDLIYLLTLGFATWKLLVKKELSAAEYTVMCTGVIMLASRVRRLLESVVLAQTQGLMITELRDFLEREPKMESGVYKPEAFRELCAKNVSFSYKEGREILHNINFCVKRGEKIALVGENGAGKSTFVNLLLHLYEVSGGSISYNGRDIREYDADSYRLKFGVVLQDFQLFGVTAAENILTHAPNEAERERVWEALELVGMKEKIESLPNGQDELLKQMFGGGEADFSGGEKQRLAIARMYAKQMEDLEKPVDVMILDEPSAALDPISEQEMFDTMFRVCEDRTVFFITHRMSAAARADRIFVLDGGTLVEQGSHSELMNRNGKYASLYRAQKAQYESRERKGDSYENS